MTTTRLFTALIALLLWPLSGAASEKSAHLSEGQAHLSEGQAHLSEGQAHLSEGQAFATVGDVVLTWADYERAVTRSVRSRFYHGSVPEGALASVRAEVAQTLVEHTLLLAEAERRAIVADEVAIAAELARYDRRYADRPEWQAGRETMLAALAADLRQAERLARLEQEVRHLPPPTEAELRAYYRGNAALFTEPERLRVSLILLAVAPSAPAASWAAAWHEAERLAGRLDAGADFSELARLHSGDESAARGGDMGYLHAGMLGESVERALEVTRPGERTEPIQVLEGIALLKLTERVEPKLAPYREVRQRARELWMREQGDRAWAALVDELRATTPVTLYAQAAGGDRH